MVRAAILPPPARESEGGPNSNLAWAIEVLSIQLRALDYTTHPVGRGGKIEE